ncbi:MAG TPA: NADH-quinone oxidoreductase subunit NuoN [Mycobacterium sp.]|jgi:NADH-quinone oxidoreductase subunit N|nr:NADH-quinone oxidoreductase subunit NuoN [Mycobacterium sp.]
MTFPTPSIEYARLSPMLIVFSAAVVGLLLEALLPAQNRYRAQLALSCAALIASFAAVLSLAGNRGSAVMGSVMVDGPAVFLQGAILVVAMAALAPIAERRLAAFTPQGSTVPGTAEEQQAAGDGSIQTEVFPLLLLATGGLLLFPVASDLLTIFVALEVLSLPLYVLCGLARRKRLLSQEAALKYLLLGAFSSALFVYGIALLYGYTGTLTLTGIAQAIGEQPHASLAVTGMGLLAAGLLFKVGAVPFHCWVPDVYQGAPTPITLFMAAATKIAAFGALSRVFYVALPGLTTDWRPVLSAVAALTMLIAAVLTVTQTDIKRLLGYSAVANAGFLLLGVSGSQAGLASTLFYLATYGLATVGVFAVIAVLRRPDGSEETETAYWAGLSRRSPTAACAVALFLLALAGIPLTSGFVAKFAVFQAAAADGAGALVVVGAISSAIIAFAYARIIVVMFFHEPADRTIIAAQPSGPRLAVIAVAAATIVLAGVVPQPLLDLASHAGQFSR